jgi:hypothetical protein
MPRRPDLAGLALALVALAGMARAQASAEPAAGAPAPTGRASAGSLGSGDRQEQGADHRDLRQPEYDYKKNVVVYRGSVQVTQAT